MFTAYAEFRYVKNGKFQLTTPLVWEAAGETITVPVGFITDFASIPQIFRSLIPVNGDHVYAAILHDYLFVIQDRPRSEVDSIFLAAMKQLGVRWSQRTAMYLAVRAGGWLPWRKNEEDKEKNAEQFFASYGLSHDVSRIG